MYQPNTMVDTLYNIKLYSVYPIICQKYGDDDYL